MSRHHRLQPAPGRRGFTAVELVIVIGIMMLLMGMAMPSVLPAIRRGKINSAVNDITMCWRHARLLAITNPIPAGAQPWHFGIAITQTAGQQASVALVLDNAAAGMPKYFMVGEDPADQSTYDNAGKPMELYQFNRNVVVAATPAGGDNTTPPTVADQTIVLYAQYGTGLPISPAKVAAGRAEVSAPCSLGVSAASALTSTVCPQVQLCTQDYATTPTRRGFATAFSIYHAGFTVAKEL